MKLTEKHSNENRALFIGHKLLTSWVVVADSESAYIYQKSPQGFELIAAARPDDRSAAPAKQQRETNKPEINKHEAPFPRELAQWLDAAQKRHAFDNLVLAAGPDMLNELRAELPDNVKEHVSAEVPKDLTFLTGHDLHSYF